MHTFVKGLGGLYRCDIWIVIENQSLPHTVLVWDLGGEVCVSMEGVCVCLWGVCTSSSCFGAIKGFTAPKSPVYLPSHISPANNVGFTKPMDTVRNSSWNFNHLCRGHLEICLLYVNVNKHSWNSISASICKIEKMLHEQQYSPVYTAASSCPLGWFL